LRQDLNLVSSDKPPQLLYFAEHGSGPALLLIHGLMISGEMFDPIIGRLAKNHRLIIPDLRGSGKSRELPPPYTVKQQAEDLVQLLRHLGIVSTDVLGYSQGGPVAEQLAVDHPELVRSLILSNTYAYNTTTLREKIEGSLVPLFIHLLGIRRFAKFVGSVGMKQVAKERADWVINLMAAQDPKIVVA
jgi:pimeloyl-ACP methyl ester carboxylesterase